MFAKLNSNSTEKLAFRAAYELGVAWKQPINQQHKEYSCE